MSSSAPSTPAVAPSAANADASARVSPVEIDGSCRWPVLALATFGCGWLLVGSWLAIVASIKLHAPGCLASCPWLTYGRVQPAAWNAYVYGFGVQAGLAVAAWLVARLSGTRLLGGRAMLLGVGVWNLGLALGLLGVLMGDATGVPTLELPRYASPSLFLGYLCLGSWIVLTFREGTQREHFVSLWYVLGALFSFPWLYSAGNYLAVFAPLRGVLQGAVESWYAQGLFVFWLTFLGLAALFYFIPKITGSPIPSRSLAIFAFWTLALFGGLGGLGRYLGGPFPAWMLSASVVAGVLTAIPLLAVALNLVPALAGQGTQIKASPVLWFMVWATGSFLAAGVLGVVVRFGVFDRILHFTLAGQALEQLTLQGFFGMAMLGALYYVVPRVVARDWPSAGLVRAHFGCAAVGISLLVLALGAGGIVQGLALRDPRVPFLAVIQGYLPFVSTGTLGYTVLFIGHLSLGLNLGLMLARSCAAWGAPVGRAWLRVAPPAAEVKA